MKLSEIVTLPKQSYHLVAIGVLLLVALTPVLDRSYEAAAAFSVLIFLALLVLLIRYKTVLLFFLAFTIPLSVSAELVPGAQLSLPAELLALLLSFYLVIKIILGFRPQTSFLRHPLTLVIVLDLAWLLVSSVCSEMPLVSFKRFFIRTVFAVGFYYFIWEITKLDLKNAKRIIFLQLGGLALIALYTLQLHARAGFIMVGSQLLARPFYFDHTIYGAALVFYVPFLISELQSQTKRSPKWLSLVFILIVTPAIFFSYSRAAWLSVLLAIILYFVISRKIGGRTVSAGLIILGLIFFLRIDQFKSLLNQTKEVSHTNNVSMHLKSVSNINTDASNKERINRWKCALRMFKDKPFSGFGPGTYQFFYGPYQLRHELTRISTFTGNKGHAHSEYLNYLSETGFPGLLIFLTLVFFSFRTAFSIIRKHPEQRLLVAGLICGLTTYYIHAFFNGFLEFDKIAFPFYSSMAVLTCLDLAAAQVSSSPASAT